MGTWVCARTGGTFEPGTATAIGLESNGRLVAGVVFDLYNGRSIAMHVAGEGNWLNRAYLQACFGYVFHQLGCVKAIGLVDSTNAQARRFDEHLGFRLEATITEAGKHGDLLIYSMTRQECRFLESNNGR